MGSPYDGWRSPVRRPLPSPFPEGEPERKPGRTIPTTPTEDLLIQLHVRLREDVEELEELIEVRERKLTYHDLKRLDKAITLLKIGCKLVKFVLKSRGFRKSTGKQDIKAHG